MRTHPVRLCFQLSGMQCLYEGAGVVPPLRRPPSSFGPPSCQLVEVAQFVSAIAVIDEEFGEQSHCLDVAGAGSAGSEEQELVAVGRLVGLGGELALSQRGVDAGGEGRVLGLRIVAATTEPALTVGPPTSTRLAASAIEAPSLIASSTASECCSNRQRRLIGHPGAGSRPARYCVSDVGGERGDRPQSV